MKLHNNIKKLRIDKGFSIAAFAKELKVSKNTVMGWEKNAWQPQEKIHKKIARILEVDITDLFYIQ